MLLRHSALYFVARGVPGLVNFLAIAVYTRLLAPEEYGRYALVVAGVGFFNAVFFQWLRLSLLRFLPAHLENPRVLLSTILFGFSALALFTGGVGLVLAWFWPDTIWRGLILLAVPLLWAQAWFELNLELARSRLQPVRYGLMNGVKAVSALGFGVLAVLWGLGAHGPLIGLLVGMVLSAFFWGRAEWKGVLPKASRPLLGELLRYGLPLTATFALGFVVSTSDRFLIAYFLGTEAAGMYAVSYDLVQNSLGFLMQTMMLAGFPLVLRDYHTTSLEATQKSLRDSTLLVLGLGIPGTVGIALLAPNIAHTVFGTAYSGPAASVLPIVAYAILTYGVLEFYYNRAFWIAKSSGGILWVMVWAAVVNVSLNLLLIPTLGMVGAAYSTLLAYISASAVSARVSRKVFPLPSLAPDVYKVILASLIMVAALWFTRQWSGLFAFLTQVFLGAGVYFAAIAVLAVLQWSRVSAWLRKKFGGGYEAIVA